MNLEIGQVLWLKIKIDEVAKEKHPMLIANINEKYNRKRNQKIFLVID